MYAMIATCTNIANVVGVVNKYPRESHWEAMKYILRQLKGSTDKCLCFGEGSMHLEGYCDGHGK